MISEKLVKAITRQINREIYSAYLYAAMGSYAQSIGLEGFNNWFQEQFKEEMMHAWKMQDYVNRKGSRVFMQEIETPPQEYASPLDLFEKTLAHEKAVTGLIHDLVKLAKDEGDEETEKFLGWYVTEQVEEETTALRVLNKVKSAGDDPKAVDQELGKRGK